MAASCSHGLKESRTAWFHFVKGVLGNCASVQRFALPQEEGLETAASHAAPLARWLRLNPILLRDSARQTLLRHREAFRFPNTPAGQAPM